MSCICWENYTNFGICIIEKYRKIGLYVKYNRRKVLSKRVEKMFSQFIQGLLNTGGQAQAMQRYSQIANKINSLNAPAEAQNPLDTIHPNTQKVNNAPSFEKVLQSTTTSNFGTLLLDPRLKQVNADIIKESPQISFSNALQEAGAIQTNTQAATKSQILNVVNQNLYKPSLSKNQVLTQRRNQKPEQWD